MGVNGIEGVRFGNSSVCATKLFVKFLLKRELVSRNFDGFVKRVSHLTVIFVKEEKLGILLGIAP